MKFAPLARGLIQDVVELPGEVINDLQPGITELPLASLTEFLYVVIPRHSYKNIGVAFGLFILMMNKKADQIFSQRQCSAVGIFDMPLPGLRGILLRAYLDRQTFKINVSPSTVQQFASSARRIMTGGDVSGRSDQFVPLLGLFSASFLHLRDFCPIDSAFLLLHK